MQKTTPLPFISVLWKFNFLFNIKFKSIKKETILKSESDINTHEKHNRTHCLEIGVSRERDLHIFQFGNSRLIFSLSMSSSSRSGMFFFI